MFEPLYERWDEAQRAFEQFADDELSRLLFEAGEDELRKTANAQQSVFGTSLAIARALTMGSEWAPDVVAGHSLGHITAATAAGVLDDRAGLDLVRKRGQFMDRAEREAGPGTMFAVLIAESQAVADVVDGRDRISIGGYNSPRQTLISGETEAVTDAADEIRDTLPRARVTEIDVHSGFHSPVMEPAIEPFTDALSQYQFSDPQIPVVSDTDGAVYQRGERARGLFGDQLVSPVRWVDVVDTLEGMGLDRIVVLPPSDEVTAMTERNTDSVEVVGLDSFEKIREIHT